jgi:hypothetical protein
MSKIISLKLPLHVCIKNLSITSQSEKLHNNASCRIFKKIFMIMCPTYLKNEVKK